MTPFRLLLCLVAADQVHSHGPHVRKTSLALRARKPERSNGLRVNFIGVCVKFAAVDEDLGAKGALDVGFLRINFRNFFGDRFVLQASLLVYL